MKKLLISLVIIITACSNEEHNALPIKLDSWNRYGNIKNISYDKIELGFPESCVWKNVNLLIKKDKVYTISFYAKYYDTIDNNITLSIIDDNHIYYEQNYGYLLSKRFKRYYFEFVINNKIDESLILCLVNQENGFPGTICIKDVILFEGSIDHLKFEERI